MFAVSGTFSGAEGTIQGTIDGSNWFDVAAVNLNDLAIENDLTLTANTNAAWKVDITGFQEVRFNLSALGANSSINVEFEEADGQIYFHS